MIGWLEAALLCLTSFVAAGVAVSRLTGWDAEEVLAAAPAVALMAAAGARFAFYVLDLAPIADAAAWAVFALGVLLGAGDIRRGLRSPRARRALIAWTILALWATTLAWLVRNYGAGNWNTDWIEHYLRARFFLGGQPYDQTFVGAALTARPPLVNLFVAEVMALAGRTFPVDQSAMLLLALCAFFPLLLLAREFAPEAPCLPLALAAWLMFSPMFVENATYTWTRQVAAWLVIAATAFYLRGRRLGDARRIVFAFLLSAAAVVAHYSAATYAWFLAFHYLAATWPGRPRAWRELAAIAAATALVLGPWIAWSASIYGPGALVTSTASYRDAQHYEGPSQAGKIALNIVDTLVPDFLRGATPDARGRLHVWGGLRQTTFMAYQSNLFFAPGVLGVTLLLLDGLRRRRDARRRDATRPPGGAGAIFWIGFVLAGVAGLAGNGAREPLGLAHLSLMPVTLTALAWLASRFAGWRPWMRALALGGLACDLALGIALHFWLQSHPLDLPAGWVGPLGLTQDDLMVGTTLSNWGLKTGHRLEFAGDLMAAHAGTLALLLVPLALAGFAMLVRSARDAQPR